MRCSAIVLAFVFATAVFTAAEAATWYVPSPECPTIQSGINTASAGDTVLVDCGIYFEHEIIMKSGVFLRSKTGEADCAIIDAQGLGKALRMNGADSSTRIEGFTFTGGSQQGVYCGHSSPVFLSCCFAENSGSTYGGGGIYCYYASPSFINCTFDRNTTVYFGGGLYGYQSSLTFLDCTFSENEAELDGGGIRALECTLEATDCLFVGNRADDGAGLYSDKSAVTLIGCIFADNVAVGRGGGTFCYYGGSFTVSHCTYYGNVAEFGAGMYFWCRCSPTVSNTIVAFNIGSVGISCVDPQSAPALSCCDVFGNTYGDWVDCIAGQLGINDNFSENPLLCAPWDGDYGLSEESPCAPANSPPGCGLIGALDVACAWTSLAERDGARAETLRLGPSVPNPFNPSTEIHYVIPAGPEPSRVLLVIYNALGQRVRTLVDADLPGGDYTVTWDGRGQDRIPAASGVYFCNLTWNGRSQTARLLLLN